jgi:hypothetical protein
MALPCREGARGIAQCRYDPIRVQLFPTEGKKERKKERKKGIMDPRLPATVPSPWKIGVPAPTVSGAR